MARQGQKDTLDALLMRIAQKHSSPKIGYLRDRSDLFEPTKWVGSDLWTNMRESGSGSEFMEVSLVGLKEMLLEAYELGKHGRNRKK